MEPYRIYNFICQSTYLLLHFVFIVKMIKSKSDTPIFRWFVACCVSMWLWVSGRFMESVVYIFMPTNNDAYVFAANFQYIGLLFSVSTYIMWGLYMSGWNRVAKNRLVQGFLLAVPVVINIIVFTNEWHRLFYTKLVMGQSVEHGALFLPSALLVLALVSLGYLISLIGIIRRRGQTIKRILLFSAFPILPVVISVIRIVSRVDRFDYTPVVMTVVTLCFYLLTFKYNELGFVTASINSIVEQSAHPIGIYDSEKGEFVYQNKAAKEQYAEALSSVVGSMPKEGELDSGNLRVNTLALSQGGGTLVTATDLTDIAAENDKLNDTIARLNKLSAELEEENRNIDAYLESLVNTRGMESKKELIDNVYDMINNIFTEFKTNLEAAKSCPEGAEEPLRRSITAAEESMAEIRKAVAGLREG